MTLRGEVLQREEVLVGERGAARRDRVGHARERERHHVGVALADDDLTLRDDLALRPVQAVEQARLLVDRRLGGVLVLRSLPRRACGRRSRPDRRVVSQIGNITRPRNESCSLFALFTNASPASTMSSRANFCFCRCVLSVVVAVGRPTEREPARDVAVEAAAAQVATRVARVRPSSSRGRGRTRSPRRPLRAAAACACDPCRVRASS